MSKEKKAKKNVFKCSHCGEENDRVGVESSGLVLYHFDLESREYEQQEVQGTSTPDEFYCIGCGAYLSPEEGKAFEEKYLL